MTSLDNPASNALPEWPKPLRLASGLSEAEIYKAGFGYERARADAAMARLRICEAVLQDIRINAHTLEDAIGYATEALSLIGPLPPPVDDLPQQQRTGDV